MTVGSTYADYSQLVILLLLQRVLGNGLECLLNVDSLLRRRLEVRNVALGLAPSHGTLLGDLQRSATVVETLSDRHRARKTYLSLVLLHINLVAEDDEGEVLRVMWTSLNEELVPPAVESLERLGAVDVVDEYTAVRAAIERNAQ